MSADNGVYVAKFSDGYRVVEAFAIENLDYYPEGSQEYMETIRSYFGRSHVYQTKEEAWLKALGIAEKCPILEYGVCYLGELPHWDDNQ